MNNIVEKTEKKNNILNIHKNCITINEYKGLPIILWFISFKMVFMNRDDYDCFFGSKVIDYLMKSSGAVSFKNENSYGIIINSDNFDKFNLKTRNFIISHELGHICNGDLENETSDIQFSEREYKADAYAKKEGFSLETNPVTLTMWEIYSLLPVCPYVKRHFVRFTRAYLFLKHLFPNIKRIMKNK